MEEGEEEGKREEEEGRRKEEWGGGRRGRRKGGGGKGKGRRRKGEGRGVKEEDGEWEEEGEKKERGGGRGGRRGQLGTHRPSHLDELLELLDVGLQLGLLDTQLLPAQVQGFHSALKYLGAGGSTEVRSTPAPPATRASAPRPPAFRATLGSEQGVPGPCYPQDEDPFSLLGGNTEPPCRTPGSSHCRPHDG